MTLSETQASRHPFDGVGLPHWLRASPNYPDRLLRMPSSLPRWMGPVLSVLAWRDPAPGSSQTPLAFPEQRAGRHPHLSFRGLLEFHSRSGLRSRSPTYSGLCHEAPVRPVDPAEPPVSYQVIPITPWVGPSPTGDLRRWGAPLFPQWGRRFTRRSARHTRNPLSEIPRVRDIEVKKS